MSGENTQEVNAPESDTAGEVNYQFLSALRTVARADGSGVIVVVEVVDPLWPEGRYPLDTLALSTHSTPTDSARDALLRGSLQANVSRSGDSVHLAVTTTAPDGRAYLVDRSVIQRERLNNIEARYVEHARIVGDGTDLEPLESAS